jgi:hypothetical protein
LPRWPAEDVRISAKLRVQGLDSQSPGNWNTYPVPVTGGGEIALLRNNVVIRLLPHEMGFDRYPRLTSRLGDDRDLGRVRITDLLTIGTHAELHVIVTASSSYTHGAARTERCYSPESVLAGRFSPKDGLAGLDVILLVISDTSSGPSASPSESQPTEPDAPDRPGLSL